MDVDWLARSTTIILTGVIYGITVCVNLIIQFFAIFCLQTFLNKSEMSIQFTIAITRLYRIDTQANGSGVILYII